MQSQIEWERMMSGKVYNPYKVNDGTWVKIHEAVKLFNDSEFWRDRSALENLKNYLGAAPDDLVLIPPVCFSHGNRIFFGKHFYANTDLTILDENKVIFGDNVFLAPHVSIYTVGHPIDAQVRNEKLMYARPVTIGSNVWIGGNVVINPGVTIGNNVVIGSGSVVTKDIPDNSVAVGNPCRVIREITIADKEKWTAQYTDYINEINQE